MSVFIIEAKLIDGKNWSFADSTVNFEGRSRKAIIYSLEYFQKTFLTCQWSRRPESQAEWKAIVWYNFGPKPSNIEKVIIKPSDCGRYICVMWDTANESSPIGGGTQLSNDLSHQK